MPDYLFFAFLNIKTPNSAGSGKKGMYLYYWMLWAVNQCLMMEATQPGELSQKTSDSCSYHCSPFLLEMFYKVFLDRIGVVCNDKELTLVLSRRQLSPTLIVTQNNMNRQNTGMICILYLLHGL
jgi:hypothetical protein